MRKSDLLVAFGICLALGPAVRADDAKAGPAGPQPATRPAAVTDLLQQRVEVAERAVRLAEKMYQSGTGSAEDLAAWSRRWLDARLAAADAPAGRLAVLREYVDWAKARERVAEDRVKTGLATPLDAEAARYARVDAELRLAQHLQAAGAAGGGGARRTDQDLIQGTWRVVGMVRNGKAAPEQAMKDGPSTVRFEGTTAVMGPGKAGDEPKEGTFRVDPSKSPRRITIEPKDDPGDRKGMTGIYDLNGDTLRIAFRIGKAPDTPPPDFEQGEGLGLMTLERQKDGKNDGKEGAKGKGAAAADSKRLQGTWAVVRKVKNGEAEDVKEHPVTLTFAGDSVTQSRGDGGGKDGKESEGTFAIDASGTPKRITLTGKTGDHAGVAFAAIYELDGDTLKLAYSTADNAGTPPKDFAGGDGAGLLVLERKKP